MNSNNKLTQDLLDNFFLKEDQKLIEKLREMRKLKESKEELSKVSGIKNEEILNKLVELKIRPEILASLSLIPLIEVAWADGKIDKKEKEAVLKAVEKSGISKDNPDYEIVSKWLEHKPSPHLLEAWEHYIQGLCENLTKEEISNLRNELISHAKEIASASGGFLGIAKISDSENKMLEKLSQAFEKRG
jgi:hypothetical protein